MSKLCNIFCAPDTDIVKEPMPRAHIIIHKKMGNNAANQLNSNKI